MLWEHYSSWGKKERERFEKGEIPFEEY